MRVLALLLVFLSIGGTALAQRGGVVLTKNEARAMGPEALTRRIFGGLAPIMLPVVDRGQPGVPATRPLRRLFFYTLPHGANWPGLCETGLVTVEFEPAGPLAGADTSVRPRRISSASRYFPFDRALLLGRVSRGDDGEEEAEDEERDEADEARRADAACAAIDPRVTGNFGAQHDYQAATAVRLLLELAEAARARRALVSLDCSALGPRDAGPSEAECIAAFATLDAAQLDWIATCDPPPAVVCHRLFIGGYQVDLTMAPNNQQLAAAKLDQLIVVADQLID
jgi:hypothetical protein